MLLLLLLLYNSSNPPSVVELQKVEPKHAELPLIPSPASRLESRLRMVVVVYPVYPALSGGIVEGGAQARRASPHTPAQVLTLDGKSEKGAHVRSNISYLISLRHLI